MTIASTLFADDTETTVQKLPTQLNNTTHDPRRWLVSIWRDPDGCDAVDIEGETLQRAICLAIAAALDLKPSETP